MTLTLTEIEQEATLEAIRIAVNEQGQRLDSGDLERDNAGEWDDKIAPRQIATFTALANVCIRASAIGLSWDCLALVEKFRNSLSADEVSQ